MLAKPKVLLENVIEIMRRFWWATMLHALSLDSAVHLVMTQKYAFFLSFFFGCTWGISPYLVTESFHGRGIREITRYN